MPSLDSVKKKTKYSPNMGKSKQNLYRHAYKRIESSISKGSHIEAVALIESIMSDRIETALAAITNQPVTASSLGTLFKKLHQIEPASDALRAAIWEWNESRGFVIHQMVKLTNDHDSTWTERITYSRKVAREGLPLLKELRKYTDRIIRENK